MNTRAQFGGVVINETDWVVEALAVVLHGPHQPERIRPRQPQAFEVDIAAAQRPEGDLRPDGLAGGNRILTVFVVHLILHERLPRSPLMFTAFQMRGYGSIFTGVMY